MGSKKVTKCLFAVYLLLLTWIILFKMQLSIESLPHLRNINLIPFGDSAIVNGKMDFDEIFSNLIIFVPFGVFMGMLSEQKSFIKKIIPVFLTSLCFEILQFAFSIGASDITDLLMNTAGGMAGIGCCFVLSKLFLGKTNKILNILCLVGMVLFLVLVGFIIAVNQ